MTNPKFSNKKTKFSVVAALPSEARAEADLMDQSIDEDRKMTVQAGIVRIMKTRKRLTHRALVAETLEQMTRFKPGVPLVKVRPGLCAMQFIQWRLYATPFTLARSTASRC